MRKIFRDGFAAFRAWCIKGSAPAVEVNPHCKIGTIYIKSRLHDGDICAIITSDPGYQPIKML